MERWELQYYAANIRSHWVELVGVAAAIASIDGLIFVAIGHAPQSLLQWSVFVSVVAAALLSLWAIIRFQKPRSVLTLELDHEHMSQTMERAKRRAQRRLVNFAGDLTWLPEDLGLMKALAADGKRVEVYYESARGNNVRDALREAVAAGIRVRKYPAGLQSDFRCLAIDLDAPEDCQIFVVEKKTASLLLREEPHYLISHHTARSNEQLVLAVRHLYSLVRSITRVTIKIGIVGTNNVGKTTLANLLTRHLRDDSWDVHLVDDTFRIFASTTTEANLQILAEQVTREVQASGRTIVCDRTLIDNFVFMKTRYADAPRCWRPLERVVIDYARSYDLVFVLRSSTSTSKSTSHVTPELRVEIERDLKRFLNDNHIEFIEVDRRPDPADEVTFMLEMIRGRLIAKAAWLN